MSFGFIWNGAVIFAGAALLRGERNAGRRGKLSSLHGLSSRPRGIGVEKCRSLKLNGRHASPTDGRARSGEFEIGARGAAMLASPERLRGGQPRRPVQSGRSRCRARRGRERLPETEAGDIDGQDALLPLCAPDHALVATDRRRAWAGRGSPGRVPRSASGNRPLPEPAHLLRDEGARRSGGRRAGRQGSGNAQKWITPSACT